jgi:hypothetical protein
LNLYITTITETAAKLSRELAISARPYSIAPRRQRSRMLRKFFVGIVVGIVRHDLVNFSVKSVRCGNSSSPARGTNPNTLWPPAWRRGDTVGAIRFAVVPAPIPIAQVGLRIARSAPYIGRSAYMTAGARGTDDHK